MRLRLSSCDALAETLLAEISLLAELLNEKLSASFPSLRFGTVSRLSPVCSVPPLASANGVRSNREGAASLFSEQEKENRQAKLLLISSLM